MEDAQGHVALSSSIHIDTDCGAAEGLAAIIDADGEIRLDRRTAILRARGRGRNDEIDLIEADLSRRQTGKKRLRYRGELDVGGWERGRGIGDVVESKVHRGDDYGGRIRTYRACLDGGRDGTEPPCVHNKSLAGMGGRMGHGAARSAGILQNQTTIRMSDERIADAGFECLAADVAGLQDVHAVWIRRREEGLADGAVFIDGDNGRRLERRDLARLGTSMSKGI